MTQHTLSAQSSKLEHCNIGTITNEIHLVRESTQHSFGQL